MEFVRQKAARADHCHVFVLACVSKNREGQELAEIGSLVESGAVGFTDADRPIHNTELMRRALEYCLMFDVPILNHPEVLELSHDGIMHEGLTSMVLGLPGMPADAEDVMTARDSAAGRIHRRPTAPDEHLQCRKRRADAAVTKSRGVQVTAEVCPAHFTLTDETLAHVRRQLQGQSAAAFPQPRRRLHRRLADGTIDVIASCHAPRASEKKLQELDRAPFGMVNLETTLALVDHSPDRTRTPRLANRHRQADDQSGRCPGTEQRER